MTSSPHTSSKFPKGFRTNVSRQCPIDEYCWLDPVHVFWIPEQRLRIRPPWTMGLSTTPAISCTYGWRLGTQASYWATLPSSSKRQKAICYGRVTNQPVLYVAEGECSSTCLRMVVVFPMKVPVSGSTCPVLKYTTDAATSGQPDVYCTTRAS